METNYISYLVLFISLFGTLIGIYYRVKTKKISVREIVAYTVILLIAGTITFFQFISEKGLSSAKKTPKTVPFDDQNSFQEYQLEKSEENIKIVPVDKNDTIATKDSVKLKDTALTEIFSRNDDEDSSKIVSIDNLQEKEFNGEFAVKEASQSDWPIYKKDKDTIGNGNEVLIFTVQYESDVYNWKIINITKDFDQKVIHTTKDKPTDFLYHKKTRRLYFKMSGKLHYLSWINNYSEIKKITLIPYRDKDVKESKFWIDKDTERLRIAIIGKGREILNNSYKRVIEFDGALYTIKKNAKGVEYFFAESNPNYGEQFKKKLWIKSNMDDIVEIFEYDNDDTFAYVTGAPTRFEARGNKGFEILDFIINNRNYSNSYQFEKIKEDFQCIEPSKCFNLNNTKELESKIPHIKKINENYINARSQKYIGHIKVNDIHDLYFPILSEHTNTFYKSYPMVLIANDFKQKILLKLDFQEKKNVAYSVSTKDSYILVQDYNMYNDNEILLFNSNEADGISIFPFKGKNTIFIPDDMLLRMNYSDFSEVD